MLYNNCTSIHYLQLTHMNLRAHSEHILTVVKPRRLTGVTLDVRHRQVDVVISWCAVIISGSLYFDGVDTS